MQEKDFIDRLIQLRDNKGVSARDMSISIGQNPGYINNIESGRALPSLSTFLYICEYFNVTPSEFFDTETVYPEELNSLISDLKQLNKENLAHIKAIVHYMVKLKESE